MINALYRKEVYIDIQRSGEGWMEGLMEKKSVDYIEVWKGGIDMIRSYRRPSLY